MTKSLSLSLITALAISTLSANMNIQQNIEFRTQNQEMNSSINSILVQPNGDIISVGYLNGNELMPVGDTPPDSPDIQAFIMKTNIDGNISWFQSFGTGLLPDESIKVFSTIDNKFVVVGSTVLPETSLDITITKFEQNGTVISNNVIEMEGREFPKDAVTDMAGNIYIAGVTDGNFSDMNGSQGTIINDSIYNGNYSSFIIKIDSVGNLTNVIQFGGDFYYSNFHSDKKISLRVNEINEINETQIYAVRSKEIFTDYNMSIDIFDSNLSTLGSYTFDNNFEGSRANTVTGFDFKTEMNNTLSLFVATRKDLQKISLSGGVLTDAGESKITNNGYSYTKDVQFSPSTNSVYLVGSEYVSGFGKKLYISKVDTESMTRSSLSFFGNSAGENSYGGISANALQTNVNGEIIVAGDLGDRTFFNNVESNFSGGGAFITTFKDNYSVVDIVAGWNMISGNFKKATMPKEVVVAYQYSARYPMNCISNHNSWNCKKVWSAFSPDLDLKNSLIGFGGLTEISEFNNSNGIWLFSESNISLNAGYNDLNISTENYSDGWNLSGIGIEINSSRDIFCKDENNHSTIVWGFNNGNWKLNSNDNSYFPTINRFDMIPPNSGFWVNCNYKPFLGFTDMNLSTCVNLRLGHLEDNLSYLSSDSERASIIDLNCSNMNIQNLSGLETLINIAELNLSGNSLSDLHSLNRLKHLINLDITGNSDLTSSQTEEFNNSTKDRMFNLFF